ncbi:dihydroxyacetone kinase phosphoryl donor subunit DhaM [Brevibacillus sp. TJ4]|uniref:dihydroxyacetone kinase phosphoryl donor subunit DhaM n=1 Tax=Brevibacillus sp. TJ4 TaxID=3234853 RepID=UPI0037D25D28
MSRVGIVLVSHSSSLVAGLHELLAQLPHDVPVATAGGTDDGEIGTSATKIQLAIEQVYSERGVIVLFDLGSAYINAELAIEWLDEGRRANVVIADAPLVEGAYAAVVLSGCGGSLQEVLNAAQEAKQLEKL